MANQNSNFSLFHSIPQVASDKQYKKYKENTVSRVSFKTEKNLSILFLTINYIDRKGSEKVSNYSKRTGRRSYPLMNK